MRANSRAQSLGEEIANSVSHGMGALAAAVAAPFLIVSAVRRGDGLGIAASSVFATTMLLLYLMSTLYHSMPRGRAKRVFQILDHCAIFLLIAGTYTPFTLGALRGAWGWTLLGLVWGIAIVGIVLKAMYGVRYPVLSIALYLGMGWLIVIAAKPLWTHLPMPGLLWLVAGGVAYTAGVGFLAAERVRYGHFVWHLFVLTGTACHFVAVLRYAG